jgi:hypothetical protein
MAKKQPSPPPQPDAAPKPVRKTPARSGGALDAPAGEQARKKHQPQRRRTCLDIELLATLPGAQVPLWIRWALLDAGS